MKALVILLSLFALVVFPIFSSKCCREPLSRGLAEKTSRELAGALPEGVTLDYDGLQAELRGQVADESVRLGLLDAVQSAAPAGRVVDSLTLAPSEPPRIIASSSAEGKIDLSGQVGSVEEMNSVSQALGEHIGANDLKVSDRVKPATWWNAALGGAIISSLSGAESGTLEVGERGAILTREFPDPILQSKSLAGLRSSLPPGFALDDRSTVAPPTQPASLVANYDGETLRLSGVVPDEATRTEVLRILNPTTGGKTVDEIQTKYVTAPGWLAGLGALAPSFFSKGEPAELDLSPGNFRLVREFPDAASRDAALAAAAPLLKNGESLKADLTISKHPFEFSSALENDRIHLAGKVASEASKTLLENRFAAAYPGKKIDNQLVVNEAVEAPAWLDGEGFGSWLSSWSDLVKSPTFSVAADKISLGGKVADSAAASAVILQAEKIFGTSDEIENRLEILPIPKKPANFSLAADKDGTITLAGAVPDAATKDALERGAEVIAGDRRVVNELVIDSNVTAPAALAEGPRTNWLTQWSAAKVKSGQFQMREGIFAMRGEVADEATRESLGKTTTALFGPGTKVDNQIAVAAPKPAPMTAATPAPKAPKPAPAASKPVPAPMTAATPAPATPKPAAPAAAAPAMTAADSAIKVAPKPASGNAPPSASPVKKDNVVREFSIYFDTNSSYFRKESRTVIEEALRIVKSTPGAKVQLVGSADVVGSSEYNDWISSERAGRVKSALVADGLTAESIAAEAIGESKAQSSDSPEIRQKDRCVTIRIVN